MRNISFAMTTAQVRARLKDVTRRTGWIGLQPGTLLRAVEKSQGLGRWQKVKPICVIRVVAVRRERLDDLVDKDRPWYGAEEMGREGFAGLDPQDFMLRYFPQIDPDQLVTRIVFEYVD